MPLDPSQVHLDLRLRVTGAYHGGLNRTTFHTRIPYYGNRAVRLLTGTMGPISVNDGSITAISVASPTRVTSVGHGLVTGQQVAITGSDSTPVIDGTREVTVVTGAITGISEDDPTVITSNGHGLVTGQSLTIVDSDSTPSVDGGHVVTVINANTFSIPVEVTGAGSTGSWTSHDQFTVPVNVSNAGTIGEWEVSDRTGFQVKGNFGTGGDAILGVLYDSAVDLSEIVPRDDQDRPELWLQALLKRLTLLHGTAGGFDVAVVDIDTVRWPTHTFTYAGALLAAPARPYHRFPVPLGRRAERCTVSVRESTYKPFTVHGYETDMETITGGR